MRFEPNTWIWVPDREDCYLPAQVLVPFAKGEATHVLQEDGELRALSADETLGCEPCNTEALDSNIEDLVHLSDLNEMSILHNLRVRFKEDKIYTNISSILISVNPFKLLPLYTPSILESYRQPGSKKQPHIFAVANNAYQNMLSESMDQSVVISGESGAGKSEATKLILQFLADVSQKGAAATASPSVSLEAKILASNPILESFGNAKTLRNNNSSRFGKLVTVNFDSKGSITGGGIVNYLLEKSRVVTQSPGERNYHIFYQLLSCVESDVALSNELKLQAAELFRYTNQSGTVDVDGISDDQDFVDMKHSMHTLQFSADIQKRIFQVVAGILHFGNVKFQIEKKATQEDACIISNGDVLAHASSLWGCDAKEMTKFLTHRNIGNRSAILVAYNHQQASDVRDAMTKRVYAELFQYLVNKINAELLEEGANAHRFIGVLDIFGFESFETNSFEQLCINFCNEKLQFHFNEHIFKMEQTLYASEGILLNGAMFIDNQPTLELLEAKMHGMFSLVDDEINIPRGSDEGVLQKMIQKHGDGKHPNFIRPKARDCKLYNKSFGIVHYAGPVFYQVTGFLDKNKDQLHPDVVQVLQKSSHPLMQVFFPVERTEPAVQQPSGRGRAGAGASSSSAANKKTLGFQFKSQLNDLIKTLNSTFPHFVRCMKSNDLKQGNVFHSARMQDQLRYSGLVEVCRIRKLGFPIRKTWDAFFMRYRCIDLTCHTLDSLLALLQRKKVLHDGEWAKGSSKMFVRANQHLLLEAAREESLQDLAVLVQKHARKMLAVRRYRYYRTLLAQLSEAVERREEAALSSLLESCFELPNFGMHIGKVVDAKHLLERVREENRVRQLLETAVQSRELNTLRLALQAYEGLEPPVDFLVLLVEESKSLLTRLEDELRLRKELARAILNREADRLQQLLSKATSMDFDCLECTQAKTLLDRLDQEKALLANLKDAIARENTVELDRIYSDCILQGLESYYPLDLQRAREMKAMILKRKSFEEEKRKLLEEEEEKQKQKLAENEANRQDHIQKTRSALETAIALKKTDELETVLQKALQTGVHIPESVSAQRLLQSLKTMESLRLQLAANLEILTKQAEKVNGGGLVENDLHPLNHLLLKCDQVLEEVGEFPEVGPARDRLRLFQKHVSTKAELEAATEEKDRSRLRTALDAAQDLGMRILAVEKAKELLQEMNVPAPVSLSKQEDERMIIARQPRFTVSNYPNLRTADDFARGAILNKSKIKEQFLTFQNTVVLKSLTSLSRELNKLAIIVHKNLLGYMGDKLLPFPAMLAKDILEKGYAFKGLRDEIYMQIIKQLTNNPRAESVAKGWQVLCMCVGTFAPSPEFEMFLSHFILEKMEKGRGAVSEYSKYCWRTLGALLSSGDGTGFVPNTDEILAYKERPPILVTLHLVSDCVITENLPITPDLNVGTVVQMCLGWLDVKDALLAETLGLFVYDLGVKPGVEDPNARAAYADLERTPRPLRNDEYLGDIFVQKDRQRRRFKIVLKQKIFHPRTFSRSACPSAQRLKYLQAEDEVFMQGFLDFRTEEDVVELSSLSIAVEHGPNIPTTLEDMVHSLPIVDFIPPIWVNRRSARKWAELVLPHMEELATVDPEDLQQRFLAKVHRHPLFGCHWFYVHKMEYHSLVGVPAFAQALPANLLLAWNLEGVQIYNVDKKLLASIPYMDICRWGGSSSHFCLIILDGTTDETYELNLATAQAADMASVTLDLIRFLMAEDKK